MASLTLKNNDKMTRDEHTVVAQIVTVCAFLNFPHPPWRAIAMHLREARAKFFPEEIARGYVLFREGLVGVNCCEFQQCIVSSCQWILTAVTVLELPRKARGERGRGLVACKAASLGNVHVAIEINPAASFVLFPWGKSKGPSRVLMNEIHVVPIISLLYMYIVPGKVSKFSHRITHKLRFVVPGERAKRRDRQIEKERVQSSDELLRVQEGGCGAWFLYPGGTNYRAQAAAGEHL